MKEDHCRTRNVVVGAVCLTVVTAVVTFFASAAMFPRLKCDNERRLQFSDKPVYREVDRMEVPEKGLLISRPIGDNKCYIIPKRTADHDADTPRPLVIINDPLSFEMIEHLAGSDAAAFCNGFDTYTARQLKADEAAATARRRRDAGYGGPAPGPGPAPIAPAPAATPAPAPIAPAPAATPAPAPIAPAPAATSAPAPGPGPSPSGYGSSAGAAGAAGGAAGAAGAAGGAPAANAGGVAVAAGGSAAAALSPLQGSAWQGNANPLFSSATDTGKKAMELPIEQRQPRCSEVLLDCVDHVGQVQSCYTWANGVLWMDRKCTDSKQFVIRMTKPPGRILKIAQQQWIVCLTRRGQGLSC